MTRLWIVQLVGMNLQGCSFWERVHRKTAHAVGECIVEDHNRVAANLIVDDQLVLQNIQRVRSGDIVDKDPGNKCMLAQPMV